MSKDTAGGMFTKTIMTYSPIIMGNVLPVNEMHMNLL